MSSISTVNTEVLDTTSTISQTNNILGKEDFLKLLITQLQYQDPLNPMDGTTFTSQLAEFTSLEKLEEINNNFDKLNVSQSAIQRSQSITLIGKDVMAYGNTIQMKQDSNDALNFILKEDVTVVNAYIYDATGNMVRSIQTETLSAGEQSIRWDGTNDKGEEVEEGVYTYKIMATGNDGKKVDVEMLTKGTVTAVNYNDGNINLSIGNKKVPIENVYKILENKE